MEHTLSAAKVNYSCFTKYLILLLFLNYVVRYEDLGFFLTFQQLKVNPWTFNFLYFLSVKLPLLSNQLVAGTTVTRWGRSSQVAWGPETSSGLARSWSVMWRVSPSGRETITKGFPLTRHSRPQITTRQLPFRLGKYYNNIW